MGVFKLAYASFRRKKSSGIVFLVMCTIAALILATGLSLMIGTDGFYNKKVDELNAPHFTTFIYEGSFKSEHWEFAENYQGVTEKCKFDSLINISTWQMKGDKTKEATVAFISEQTLRTTFYSPPVIDKQPTKGLDSIILPLSFKTSGFKSGQKITVASRNKSDTFTIYGFYEDALAGSSTFGIDIALIDGTKFDSLATEATYIKYNTIMLRFNKPTTSAEFTSTFNRTFSLGSNETFFITYEDSEMSATTFTNMMSMIMMVFAVIVLIIAFIVVMFSIRSSISEEIKSIGVLKSIGYADGKLRFAQIIKYLCIAAVGAVIGATGSIFFFMLIGNIIASTSGLLWLGGTNFLPACLSILIIAALTVLISWVFTLKYKKITPVNALRRSSTAKVRGGNVLPLSKTAMLLDVHMGTKRFISSITSNVSLFVIISLLVFISLLVNVLNYNMNTDRSAMIQMVGLEMSEVYVQASNPGVDLAARSADILQDSRVSRIVLTGERAAYVGDTQFYVEILDFSQLSMSTIVKGRYPSAAGEIALSATDSQNLGKKMGSTLSIEINGNIEQYEVVGISQGIGNSTSKITIDSILKHDANYTPSTLYVYLKSGTDTNAFMNDLKNSVHGEDLLMVNTEEQMDTILSSMGDPIQMLTGIMMVMNVIIVAFVLYLMISTIIRKTKQEFGILKALGFTNRRLVVQLLLSLLPSLLLGALMGILFGFVLTNPILSVFFGSVGLLKATFIIPTLASFLIALSIFGAGVIATYVISLKLKTISPQKLISE